MFASTPKWPAWKARWDGSSFRSRSCIVSEAVTICAHFSPARFQAFEAETSASPFSVAASPIERNGTCSRPGHRHRGVNLVGDHDHVVSSRELRDSLQLRSRERRSRRVVRMAEQVGLRPGRERLLEAVEIEPRPVAGLEQRHLDDGATHLA